MSIEMKSRVSFYIVVLLARVNARLQVLLQQGFSIPSGKIKTETRNLIATDKTQLAHRYDTVVPKWSPSPQST